MPWKAVLWTIPWMQFLRAASHSIMHAQPLQTRDDRDDESDPADHAADEDTANVDFHRLVGHVWVCQAVWQMWSLCASSAFWCGGSGAMRAFTFVLLGQTLSAVASMDSGLTLNAHTHGAAYAWPVLLDSARITDKRALAYLIPIAKVVLT